MGGTHGARAFESLSALEGPTCRPFRVGPLKRLYPWAAGTKSVPLPTATQFEPPRGSEGEGAGGQGGAQVTAFEAARLIKPPALCLTRTTHNAG